MVNIIIQLSKYVIIILMAAYTFSCFSIFTRNYEDEEKRVLIRQDVLMFLLQFAAFGTMYLATKDIRILFLYAVLTVILLAVILLYNLIYPNVSRLVVNNMCMLITVGMIMITRLSADNPSPYGTAVRQLVFVALGITFGLVVPVLIRKMKFLDQWTYIYAAVGGAALLAVALFAQISGGAKLGFEIAGINIQPSEFVKIIFVFFVAASLNKSKEFKNIVVTTAIAGSTCIDLSSLYGFGSGTDLLCCLSCYAFCRDKTMAVCDSGTWSRSSRGSCRLSFVFAYSGQGRGVAGSHRDVQRKRLSSGTIVVCDRYGKLVWDRTF